MTRSGPELEEKRGKDRVQWGTVWSGRGGTAKLLTPTYMTRFPLSQLLFMPIYEGDPPNRNFLLEGRLLVLQASPTR